MGVFFSTRRTSSPCVEPGRAAFPRGGHALQPHSTPGRKRFPPRPPSSSSQGVGGRKTARCLSFTSPTTLRCAVAHFHHYVIELFAGALAPGHRFAQAGAAALRCGGPPTCDLLPESSLVPLGTGRTHLANAEGSRGRLRRPRRLRPVTSSGSICHRPSKRKRLRRYFLYGPRRRCSFVRQNPLRDGVGEIRKIRRVTRERTLPGRKWEVTIPLGQTIRRM